MRPFHVGAALLTVIAGCGSEDGHSQLGALDDSQRLLGDSSSLAEGDASTWATLDSNGALRELGISLTAEAIDTAADTEEAFLALPATAHQATLFDHVAINYRRHGHGPESVYGTPHFDIHLYSIDAAARMAIDCDDEPMPAPSRIPEPYFVPSPAPEPEGTCVAGMGVHALNPTSPELNADDPAPFTHTLIVGYHGGEIAFVEPMITTETLQAREPFSYELNRPDVLPQGGAWPTMITGRYDEERLAYDFVLSGFVSE
jgi:hypothetical protein